MSKILLISCSFEEVSLVMAGKDNPEGIKTGEESHYPLGIGYLHSCLEAAGHEVKTLFHNNHTYDDSFREFKRSIDEFAPDLIGYQMLTVNRASTFRFLEYVHQNHQNIKQITGGIHATILYEQILRKYPFLYIVLGEGEITFPELIESLAKNDRAIDAVDGIAFSRDGSMVVTRPRKLIEDLDVLPFPKHELFFNAKRTYGNILTSRGCPFNCSFCCLDHLSQRRVRKRSVANVMEEIEWMMGKFPNMKAVWIHDDTFFIDNQRAIEFCDEIIKRGLKINFVCSGRIKPISEELVMKLEKANFKKVLLGLESGDEGILKKCHKNITQADVEHAFRLFAKTDIFILAFLIVGLPGETDETIKVTADFVKKLQRIKYVPYSDSAILSVYPGTEVYEIAKTGKMINDDFWLTDAPTPLFTLENSQERLIAMKERLLDNIAMERFFTLSGFKAQFFMAPYILKYILKHPEAVKGASIRFMKKIMPKKIYSFIKKIYWTIKKYEKH
jgi:anaerobic magnesium-protoporphyrin IX monomethyl ester cyclase